jgi:Zn finger protein HypA/HybF involved in hydrogenase expression
MHEMMFAQKVMEQAEAAGAKEKAKVEIGELCEITADELREGLQRLSSGVLNPGEVPGFGVSSLSGVGNGVSYEVDEVESKIRCVCGFLGRAEIFDRGHGYCLFRCPECQKSGGNVEVLAGGEIKVVGVE